VTELAKSLSSAFFSARSLSRSPAIREANSTIEVLSAFLSLFAFFYTWLDAVPGLVALTQLKNAKKAEKRAEDLEVELASRIAGDPAQRPGGEEGRR